VLAKSSGQRVQILVALALAEAGDSQKALAIANRLNRQFPLDTLLNNYWLPSIRAAALLNLGNPSRAVEILRPVIPYQWSTPQGPTNVVLYPVYLRGLAFLADGKGELARNEFQQILDHRGLASNYPLGALAHLGLARALAREASVSRGNRQSSAAALSNARRAYADFLALWKDADPAVPVFQQALSENRRLLATTN
jgi:tetratricopeptide (TPR) repeat protein